MRESLERTEPIIVDSESFFQKALDLVLDRLNQRQLAQPFHLFLSGGSTPAELYRRLSEASVAWENVHLWWGDERFVPHDHPESNYCMAHRTLLRAIDLPPWRLHPWPILSTPELSAETYARDLHRFFLDGSDHIDLQILGIGTDGHTASLFPGNPALEEKERLCAVSRDGATKLQSRLTLTLPVLNMSRTVLFLAKGFEKAEAISSIYREASLPAARVSGQDQTLVLLDAPAASKL